MILLLIHFVCFLLDSLKHTIFKAKNHHYWKPSFLLFSKLEEKKIIERTPIDQMYISYNWCQIFPNIWSNLDLSLSTKECYGLFCESEKIYTFPNKLSLSQLCNSNKVSIRLVGLQQCNILPLGTRILSIDFSHRLQSIRCLEVVVNIRPWIVPILTNHSISYHNCNSSRAQIVAAFHIRFALITLTWVKR